MAADSVHEQKMQLATLLTPLTFIQKLYNFQIITNGFVDPKGSGIKLRTGGRFTVATRRYETTAVMKTNEL